MKILFINLGYARGISGQLHEHIRYAHRHFYCPPAVQRQSILQLNGFIESEQPDICCFVEIDKGSLGTAKFNQLDAIRGDAYPFSDIENKYGLTSILRSFGPTAGKSNGFMAKQKYEFEKLFFRTGVKRLIYKIRLEKGLTLFFAHFSLQQKIRRQQIIEAGALLRETEGEIIWLGDFNVLTGLDEIKPLLEGGRFQLLNQRDLPTFFFHKTASILDLCICSSGISAQAKLRILPQPYTDHAALVLDMP